MTSTTNTVTQIHERADIDLVMDAIRHSDWITTEGRYRFCDELTEASFAEIQHAAGPCAKLYEACEGIDEYLEYWWRGKRRPCVGEVILDVIRRERLLPGDGDWYTADGTFARPDERRWFIGLRVRLLGLLKPMEWRVTRAENYTAHKCLGKLDVTCRQGHYVRARTPEEALVRDLRPDLMDRFGGTAETWEPGCQRAFQAWFVGTEMYKSIRDDGLLDALRAKFTE